MRFSVVFRHRLLDVSLERDFRVSKENAAAVVVVVVVVVTASAAAAVSALDVAAVVVFGVSTADEDGRRPRNAARGRKMPSECFSIRRHLSREERGRTRTRRKQAGTQQRK